MKYKDIKAELHGLNALSHIGSLVIYRKPYTAKAIRIYFKNDEIQHIELEDAEYLSLDHEGILVQKNGVLENYESRNIEDVMLYHE